MWDFWQLRMSNVYFVCSVTAFNFNISDDYILKVLIFIRNYLLQCMTFWNCQSGIDSSPN